MSGFRSAAAALLLGVASTLLLHPALAQPVTYINNIAPFVYTENNVQQGVVHELVHLLAKRRGYDGAILATPLKRRVAQLGAQSDTFGVIWRQPDNETDFTWLFKLLDDQVVLMTTSDSKADISSVASAKNLRIGVILGSPAETMARRLGFAHIEPISNVESNASKMQVKRIDAWLGLASVAAYAGHAGNGSVKFRRGPVVGTASLYFACGRRCDQSEARKWTEAYNGMKADGTLAAVLAKYHFH